MTTKAYRRMILEGTRDLPNEALAEIVDFVLFLRKRTFDRESFDRDMQSVLVQAELSELSRQEEEHLEREFEGYDQEFPENEYAADTVALVLRVEQRKMGAAAKRAFELAEVGQATLYVPVFTLAEIMYLWEKKRIDTTLKEVTAYIARFPNVIEQPLNGSILEVAAQITDIPELHDRLIVATARYFNRPLLTNDHKIRASAFVETIWD